VARPASLSGRIAKGRRLTRSGAGDATGPAPRGGPGWSSSRGFAGDAPERRLRDSNPRWADAQTGLAIVEGAFQEFPWFQECRLACGFGSRSSRSSTVSYRSGGGWEETSSPPWYPGGYPKRRRNRERDCRVALLGSRRRNSRPGRKGPLTGRTGRGAGAGCGPPAGPRTSPAPACSARALPPRGRWPTGAARRCPSTPGAARARRRTSGECVGLAGAFEEDGLAVA
jgi:hypothetical protein